MITQMHPRAKELATEQCAVLAPEVLDLRFLTVNDDARVATGNSRDIQPDGTRRITTNQILTFL